MRAAASRACLDVGRIVPHVRKAGVGDGQPGPGTGEVRIDGEAALQQLDRLLQALAGSAALGLHAQEIEVVGIEVLGRLALGGLAVGSDDLAGIGTRYLAGDGFGQLALHGEHVAGRAVPALGPDVARRVRVDQPRRNPYPFALALDGTVQDVDGRAALGRPGGRPPPCPCRRGSHRGRSRPGRESGSAR